MYINILFCFIFSVSLLKFWHAEYENYITFYVSLTVLGKTKHVDNLYKLIFQHTNYMLHASYWVNNGLT